ncbi:MAG: hypothetical protein QOE38_1290 [Thermoleophilaceae bacterium]|nr:hypothetical protein [Thermoleophilaceae bacterium]
MSIRVVVAALVAALGAGFLLGSGGGHPPALAEAPPAAPRDLGVPAHAAAVAKQAARRGVDVYRGVGAWVDMYDAAELGDPWPALVEMRSRGVRTLYFETASWRVPSDLDFRDEQAVELYLDEAHALGLRVVAWYLPGLDDLRMDLRRSRAVLSYVTPRGGQRFDGFAVDIESQRVRAVPARNAALMRYSRALRRLAGPGYALGAIVPDLRSTTVSPGLWPGFPFRAAARYYDVFLPMAYSTYRGHGGAFTYRYARANVAGVRALTGGRPVHVIGGLSDGLSAGEAAGFVRGARSAGAIGASFYDFAIGQDWAWRALRLFR